MVKSHVEESLGANPADAALNPADSVAMGVPAARAPRLLESPRARAFRALRNPPFRLLFSAFLVNQTGFWISHVSLQGLMAHLSGSDATQQGRLFFAMFIPAFVLAPMAGVAADRFDRKRIVLACYAGVAAVTAALAVAAASGSVTPLSLQGFGFGLGLCFAFSGPANMALAANSVPDDDLSSAVSLQSTANNLTRVVGPALAAPLLATSRFEIAFAVFTVAAILAALLTARMKPRPYEPEAEEGGILARLAAGLAHARERRPALPALITVAWVSLFGVSHVALTPIFAKEVLGDADWFAWIVVTTGIGAMAGALTSGYRVGRPTLRAAAGQTFAFGMSLLAFAASTSPPVALLVQVFVGYFYFAVMTNLQRLIQEIVAEQQRGRVMSLFQVAWGGIVPFGGLAMGYAADSLGTSVTIAVGGALLGVYASVLALVGPRLDPLSADA
ncbi:MAG: hypothetical protein CL910_05205 [Deltaproteobacteria bacterium]|nr:hypothetical protein [Deltaproteobacteria bacterium]